MGFLAVTEHPDAHSTDVFDGAARAVEQAGEAGFVVLPGVEGATRDGLHVMGIGVRRMVPLPAMGVGDAIRAVRGEGGVAVLAHPTPAQIHALARTGLLPDGIEVWNALRGGWAPDPRLMRTLDRLGPPWSGLPRFGGPDAHRPAHLFKVTTVLEVASVSRSEVLEALREGRFHVRRGLVRMDAIGGRLQPGAAVLFHLSRGYLRGMRLLKRRLHALGLEAPEGLVRAAERLA